MIACGGFVGAIVNGGLIFRGTNSVTGFNVYNTNVADANKALDATYYKNLYANLYVGRVINGYAVNEGTSTLDNTTKHYTIDSISPPTSDANKLDVNGSTIAVPDAQSLFVMSLITQSTAGTSVSAGGDYGTSQSYGINSGVFCGSNHLGDYSQVGLKKTVIDSETNQEEQVIYTNKAELTDYNNKAKNDVANSVDATRKTAVSYIISAYTKAYSGTYPARTITGDNAKFWDITLAKGGNFDLSGYTSFRGIGCMGNKSANYSMKVATFDGNENTIKLSMLESRYGRSVENYFHLENKSTTTAYNGDQLDGSDYGHDNNLYKLLGLGLFDSVNVKYDTSHPYQFQNFKLQGTIAEKVYNSSGNDITGTDAQSQLFCIGGVVGKRISTENSAGGYESDLNFKGITFDGLTISGAYSCGGLIGIDALKKHRKMQIVGCNSTDNGIEITGGYYGKDAALRHGIGSFVGMTFWCRPVINGDDSETEAIETSTIYVSNITFHYTGTAKRCNVGGLIGYSGTGAEIKNIKLKGIGTTPVIGADTVYNSAGFVGFSQASEQKDDDYLQNSIWMENCTLEDVSVKALTGAAGFYGRSNQEAWGPRYIYISGCAVIGTKTTTKPEISASGSGTSDTENIVGGFVSGFFSTGSNTGVIENSYISGYKIQGYNVGGLIGRVSQKDINLKNISVKNCDIVTSTGSAGGVVGYSENNLNGYNMKIENVKFTKKDGTDNTSGAGAFVGKNSANTLVDKFVAVAKYHTDASKVPSADVKTNPNSSSFIVFSDYTGQSLTAGKNTENISSFGKNDSGKNITDQNKDPYLTFNPSSKMGKTSAGIYEYISGDGAYQLSENLTGYENYTSGKSAAARIYADYVANTNRSYKNVVMTSPIANDNTTVSLGSYFTQTASSGNFKVSTWNTEMGVRDGVDDFTLLVINDANDPENTTIFIDNYIRLMTNTSTHYMKDDESVYHVAVTPCRYNSETHKFELHSDVASGLTKNGESNALNGTDGKRYQKGYYQMELSNADSKYDDQFTLIDVQFYDPTDTAKSNKRIAYHLYVPVLTKKTVNIQFSAASISGSDYKAQEYIDKITTEITQNGKNANAPTTIVDSMDVWTTTYIRFTYPADQVNELLKLGSDLQWNHDKQVGIYWTRENNIPADTKMVLIDPNNDEDKAYYSTAGHFSVVNKARNIDFSEFTVHADGSGGKFHEQTLYSLLYDKVTVQTNSAGKGAYEEKSTKTANSLTFKIDGVERYFEPVGSKGTVDLVVAEDLSEDYYLSLYVPKTSGQADVVQIQPSGMLGTVNASGGEASGNVIRATVTSRLNAALIIGDFYVHTVDSFIVNSEQNSNIISEANKILTATTSVTISLIDDETHQQAYYFATTLGDSSVHLYHSFNLQMICNDTINTQTDIIQGIEKNNITATYSINNGEEQTVSGDNIIREASYIQCTTGDIKSYLINSANGYTVKIDGKAVMNFADFNQEFPPNPNDIDGIGVRGAVRSNIAYQPKDLPYSKMYAKMDPVNPFYYTDEDNSALFSFDAVDELDEEEIGTNTQNNSKLGVNDYYTYNNVIHGKAVYNTMDVKDYENSTSIEYTLKLFRKTTVDGVTEYQQVNIPDYITNVTLSDSEISSTGANLVKQEREITLEDEKTGETTVVKQYIYTRNLDLSGIDKDAIFSADFSCKVLKDEEFTKKEYANYKIQLTVRLNGSVNNERTAYIIYTNAKIDPSMIEEANP